MKKIVSFFSFVLLLISCGPDHITPPPSSWVTDQPFVPGNMDSYKPKEPSYPDGDGKPIDKALLIGKWSFEKRSADVYAIDSTATARILNFGFFPMYDNLLINTTQGVSTRYLEDDFSTNDPNLTILLRSGYMQSDVVTVSFEFEFDSLEFTQDKFSYRFCDKLAWGDYTIEENAIHLVFADFESDILNIINEFHDFAIIRVQGDSLLFVNDETELYQKEFGGNSIDRVTRYREYKRVR
jgi:hypothetical protein